MPPPSEWVLESDTRDTRRCLDLGRQRCLGRGGASQVRITDVPLHHYT